MSPRSYTLSPLQVGCCAAFLLLVALLAHSQAEQQQDRILRAINNSEVRLLHGNLHPLARLEFDRGRMPDSMSLPRITMFFAPSPAQQAALGQLLSQQQDPSSPNYHRWLTPRDFGARFGLSTNDLIKITTWLQSRGFVIEDVPESHNAVSFSGSGAQVSVAFGTQIHRYVVDGQQHYANTAEPSLPAAVAGIVSAITGLNDFRPRPALVRRDAAQPQPDFTDGSTNHFLAPSDFGAIYDVNPLYSRGIDGTGQKIAVAGQSDIQLGDIQQFRALMNLPAVNPQILLVPGSADPGFANGDFQEADLDLEWTGAVARNATIIYVNSSNAWWSLQYAVTNDIAPVISVSYGACEPDLAPSEVQIFTQIGQQANAQGQTIVAASGDAGAAACDAPLAQQATRGLAVSIPASLPYATAVGGSEFSEGSGTYWSTTNTANNSSVLSYIPEIGWNDTSSIYGIEATGGGPSKQFSKPIWQSGAGVPNDGVRDVPDVSLNASANHDGYLVCDESFDSNSKTFTPVCPNGAFGGFTAVGGTSAGTPAFAAIVALLNQTMNSPQGNINYALYQLAARSPSPLHNIAIGNNIVPCQMNPPTPNCPTSGASAGAMGYSAAPGYNVVTGLGSIDASLLLSDWTTVNFPPDFDMTVSPPNLSLTRGTPATAQITVTDVGGLSGTPSFSCSVPGIFVAVTCSVAPASAAANVFTLTLTSTGSAADFPAGPRGVGSWRAAPVAEAMTLLSHEHSLTVWALITIALCALGCLSTTGKLKLLPLFGAALSIAALIGCAGATSGSSSSAARIGNAPLSIQLTPQAAVLGPNGHQQFTANVGNTSNAAVNWSITPAVGNVTVVNASGIAPAGASAGSAIGLYTAPSTFTANQSVTVTATSVADPTRQASANVLLVATQVGNIQLTGTVSGKTHTLSIPITVN